MNQIWVKQWGIPQIKPAFLDPENERLLLEGRTVSLQQATFDVPISGTVYNILFNDKEAYERFKPFMTTSPYMAPPKAPVLYMKPFNTLIGDGVPIPVPKGYSELSMGPSLGIVIGKRATKVKQENALSYIRGYVIANDVQIPHTDFFRPALKETARDGFCPIGPWIIDQRSVSHPEHLTIRVIINGKAAMKRRVGPFIRPVETLIAEVTDFMTLEEGDVLLTGIHANAPYAKIGDEVIIEIEGVGKLKNRLIPEVTSKGEGK